MKNNKFLQNFSTAKPIIGMVHFPPLLGCGDYPGYDIALDDALADLAALEAGGVDGILFENNYDQPHHATVGPQVVSLMTLLGREIKNATKLPVGISVLWNDYRAALSIAKTIDLQFVRIPAFVDRVETKYGIMEPVCDQVATFQKEINTEKIAILTDVHVKHAKLLSEHSLDQSIKLAEKFGSDGIIITGNWTGEAPILKDLRAAKKATRLPVVVGSGADDHNVGDLLPNADSIIVSTSLKDGSVSSREENMKPWKSRIAKEKVESFMESVKSVRLN